MQINRKKSSNICVYEIFFVLLQRNGAQNYQKILIMKRFTLSLLALMACLLTFAATTVKIDSLYYSLGTTTATVIADQTSDKSVYSAYTTVTIPATVTYNNYTYAVNSIATSAFESCSNLQSVVLPASITTIGTDAFYGCTRLASVTLVEGLTAIYTRAFYNCNLSSVTIPHSVTSIGNAAFKNNPLTSVTWLPATCTVGTESNAPFYNSSNSQITSFVLGDSVQTIPSYLCYGMTRLDTVVLLGSLVGPTCFPRLHLVEVHQSARDAEDAACQFPGGLLVAGNDSAAHHADDHQPRRVLRLCQLDECDAARGPDDHRCACVLQLQAVQHHHSEHHHFNR